MTEDMGASPLRVDRALALRAKPIFVVLAAVAASIPSAGCGYRDGPPQLRECVLSDGGRFLYQQRPFEPAAEEMKAIVNRHGVRDTQGWWRHERDIVTCRDVRGEQP